MFHIYKYETIHWWNCYNLAMTGCIVFADIDGTLLNSDHKLSLKTKSAILSLQKQGIPFVIVSARPPMGIYPILEENHFSCPIVAFSGGMILDENRNVLFSSGFSLEKAKRIIEATKEFEEAAIWNIYSPDRWLVPDGNDFRVRREADIVHAEPETICLEDIPEDICVNKVLLMVDPQRMDEIEAKMKSLFQDLTIAKSCEYLLELNLNVNKAMALRKCCEHYGVDVASSIAFGDNYNDMPMLLEAGTPYLMGNAPEELKRRIANVTLDNDHDGIFVALQKLHLIS